MSLRALNSWYPQSHFTLQNASFEMSHNSPEENKAVLCMWLRRRLLADLFVKLSLSSDCKQSELSISLEKHARGTRKWVINRPTRVRSRVTQIHDCPNFWLWIFRITIIIVNVCLQYYCKKRKTKQENLETIVLSSSSHWEVNCITLSLKTRRN